MKARLSNRQDVKWMTEIGRREFQRELFKKFTDETKFYLLSKGHIDDTRALKQSTLESSLTRVESSLLFVSSMALRD